MYVKVGDLVATSDNVVLKIKKWPSTIRGIKGLGGLIVPDSVNQYDNGRELYLGEVVNSDNDFYKVGDDVAVDIYFGSHVPSEEKSVKIKIVPATGIVLKSEKPLEVMGDITKMEPGINKRVSYCSGNYYPRYSCITGPNSTRCENGRHC